jgi:hypothetical protein
MIELKAEEFRNLTQGSLSVAEYRDKFAQLSRYAPHEVANEVISSAASWRDCMMGYNCSWCPIPIPIFRCLWIALLWWITSVRRWMPREKGFRDRPLVATLVCVLVFSKVINRGLLLVVESWSGPFPQSVPATSPIPATEWQPTPSAAEWESDSASGPFQ